MLRPWAPCRIVSICSVGSGFITTGSSLSGGNAPGSPMPVPWWHAEQVLAYNEAPWAGSNLYGPARAETGAAAFAGTATAAAAGAAEAVMGGFSAAIAAA